MAGIKIPRFDPWWGKGKPFEGDVCTPGLATQFYLLNSNKKAGKSGLFLCDRS
jgi:hypothetical protein